MKIQISQLFASIAAAFFVAGALTNCGTSNERTSPASGTSETFNDAQLTIQNINIGTDSANLSAWSWQNVSEQNNSRPHELFELSSSSIHEIVELYADANWQIQTRVRDHVPAQLEDLRQKGTAEIKTVDASANDIIKALNKAFAKEISRCRGSQYWPAISARPPEKRGSIMVARPMLTSMIDAVVGINFNTSTLKISGLALARHNKIESDAVILLALPKSEMIYGGEAHALSGHKLFTMACSEAYGVLAVGSENNGSNLKYYESVDPSASRRVDANLYDIKAYSAEYDEAQGYFEINLTDFLNSNLGGSYVQK